MRPGARLQEKCKTADKLFIHKISQHFVRDYNGLGKMDNNTLIRLRGGMAIAMRATGLHLTDTSQG